MKNERNYDNEHFDIVFNEKEMVKQGYEILNFNMSFMENSHTMIKMTLKIKKAHFHDWELFLNHRSYKDDNDFGIVLQWDKRKYFSGVVTKLTKGIHDDHGYKLDIEIVSKSLIMDRTKYIAVYQNPKISYFDIIKNIVMSYDGKVNIMGITGHDASGADHPELDKRIENGLIVQYNETDWEFMIRILSHLGLALYNSENGSINIGFPKQTTEELQIDEKDSNTYETIEKIGIKMYRSKKIDTLSFYVPGDKLYSGSGIYGYVSSGNIFCKENKFYGTYTIKDYDYIHPYIYNEKIVGATLEGKIKRVPYTTGNKLGVAAVTVDFIDGVILKAKQLSKENSFYKVSSRNDYIKINGTIERQQLPYITPYSQTKTGLFCTPEVGDNVLVYFGTNIESAAYVIGSIKNERSIRFSNPFERNYVTTGDELNLRKKLDEDMCETDNTKNMLSCVEASVDKLINLSIREDKYGLFVKAIISEESKVKSALLHESLNITAKERYSLNSDNIDVIANSNYTERADNKKEDIDNKTGIYNSKQEEANNVAIVTNTHSIKVR